jgi:hypothetical protein
MNKARIPPVVCRKARVLSTSFVIVYAYCGVQHILSCVFVFTITQHAHTNGGPHILFSFIGNTNLKGH